MLFHIGFVPAHQVAQIIRILQTGVDLIIAKAANLPILLSSVTIAKSLPARDHVFCFSNI